MSKKLEFTRRNMLKLGAAAGAASVFQKTWGQAFPGTCVSEPPPVSIHDVTFTGCGVAGEAFPLSPFILNPFVDPLPVPKAMAPGYRHPDGRLAAAGEAQWLVREKNNDQPAGTSVPGFGVGYQDSFGERPFANDGVLFQFKNPDGNLVDAPGSDVLTKRLDFGGARAGTHQLFPGGKGVSYANLTGQAKTAFDALNPDPILYHIRLQVATHQFTSSDVQPIGRTQVEGVTTNVLLPPGANPAPGQRQGTFKLPPTTMYVFNGTFPGPMINFEYGRPAIVRFENDLDQNPLCLDRQNFGAPDWAFLTHLHNGHTSPESDGNPHALTENGGGYWPGQWSDNLYLGYAAGGFEEEKQSFLWFHDHRMHHTGPNVYKGMVGLMPHYDPQPVPGFPQGRDPGDERVGLRLPGVRTNNPNGTFDVAFDVPLALYDCVFDDGVTPGSDQHTPLPECGLTHPEWWGKLFLRHYPNHGFVGDVFTVNCVAYPVLNVERRKYRFRFLGASLARQYLLSFRQGNLVPAPGRQGQWSFGIQRGGRGRNAQTAFNLGTQCLQMVQIASEGGLLPTPILRNDVEIWPAKRREMVVDFTRYMDGSPTRQGDVIYLTNTAEMLNGRKIDTKNRFATPLLKIVITGAGLAPDASTDKLRAPVPGAVNTFDPNYSLRPRFTPPGITAGNAARPPMDMLFTLQRGGGVPEPGQAGTETEWLINGLEFVPDAPMWAPTLNSFETWGMDNGGGGWTHPMHIHQEEHQVIWRQDTTAPHPEDPIGKEDVVALEGSEGTTLYRGFRTFLGPYVAHCHQLAHEDHNMMYGWSITK